MDKVDGLYPAVLDKNMSETASAYSCIGKGWFPLVTELYENLILIYPDFVIDQVKEKFGGLRFYISNYPDNPIVKYHVEKMIRACEDLSFEVCDVCGESGEKRMVTEWLIATRCDKHSTGR